MTYTAETIINLAKQEVGYKEKATNSQLDDKTANAGITKINYRRSRGTKDLGTIT